MAIEHDEARASPDLSRRLSRWGAEEAPRELARRWCPSHEGLGRVAHFTPQPVSDTLARSQAHERARSRSSAGQSSGFLNRWSEVRVLPGPPMFSRAWSRHARGRFLP